MSGKSSKRVSCSYWGVRGTLPVPGHKSLRYGGNTSCMTLSFDDGQLFVFDAGSGIKELSNHLMSRRSGGISARIFISHPHWDHINSLPYFAPLYMPGNAFEIYGPVNRDLGIRELVGAQMDGVFFPITMREFRASVVFRDLEEESLSAGDVRIHTLRLNHPGNCLGYRIEYGAASVCYVTDNELVPARRPEHDAERLEKLVEFVRGTDLLITDATYTDAGYERRVGWGHSSVGQVVDLAHRGGVEMLHLFHHDPEQSDDDIDEKLKQARAGLERLGSSTRCEAPAEGQSFEIERPA